jgi:hypothetical protein
MDGIEKRPGLEFFRGDRRDRSAQQRLDDYVLGAQIKTPLYVAVGVYSDRRAHRPAQGAKRNCRRNLDARPGERRDDGAGVRLGGFGQRDLVQARLESDGLGHCFIPCDRRRRSDLRRCPHY